MRSKKLSLRIRRNCSLVRPFWYSSRSSISPRSTSTTVPNFALRSTMVSAFRSLSARSRQCLLDTDSSLITMVPSRLLPTCTSPRTSVSTTYIRAGSELTCRATQFSRALPSAPNTCLISLSVRQSAWHTSQLKALAQAQQTPGCSWPLSTPLRLRIHSTRHCSWMYLAEPEQLQTVRKGLAGSMVLLQQNLQAGLLSTREAFSSSEQKEQANTLCRSAILGCEISSQWFLPLLFRQKRRSTCRLALPSRTRSPSLSRCPLCFLGTIRQSGSLLLPSNLSLMKKWPWVSSILSSGTWLGSCSRRLRSLSSRKASSWLSSLRRSSPAERTTIFSCKLGLGSEQSNSPQHSSRCQV